MLDRRAVVLVKDEATYNTDSVPVAGTDAIMSEDFKWAFASSRMHQRKPIRASLAMMKPIYAGTLITVSGKTEVKGSGAAGTAPEIAPLLRASGWAETVTGGVSVTYKPTSVQASIKSSSIYFYDDGLLLKITGARGKTNFDLAVGSCGYCNWEFTGHFVSVTDVALPAATYDSTAPVPLLNVPFTADSFAAVIAKLAFDLGVEIATSESISATDGYGEVTIVGHNVTGSFDPARVLKATYDFIGKWQGGNVMTLDTGLIGGTAGNKYQITMPAITHTEVGRGNRNNVGTYEMKFAAAENTGDDEVSIVFT
jgi:hypothetical protein